MSVEADTDYSVVAAAGSVTLFSSASPVRSGGLEPEAGSTVFIDSLAGVSVCVQMR